LVIINNNGAGADLIQTGAPQREQIILCLLAISGSG